ncbi:TetR/AcrR family transcriptional regulator [Paenalkalicoccus suaedae]|uniref:TetR/AcrR family transcriptional regulator n=1 Tax=Paenalkalicoccus suaedae TaxID=2592382 RepID=A0A859FBC5_9BACI|nr:TetR/AcrR family transcriptional regulator [Paenalkalicoccus suaedae]QKS70337.1 TetR/AcrR family transcriptional regulator [Paenalkalicoccus suaedae]
MSKKLDHRKRYTRKVLKDSLITLMAEKKIAAITVKEICALAKVNRSTFYAHFKDPFDLLDHIEEEISEDMQRYLENIPLNSDEVAQEMTEQILHYLKEHRMIIETLLNHEGAPTFEKKLMTLTRQYMVKGALRDAEVDDTELRYLTTFVLSGAIHVIKDWIEQDMVQSPAEIARMINSFVTSGFSYLR